MYDKPVTDCENCGSEYKTPGYRLRTAESVAKAIVMLVTLVVWAMVFVLIGTQAVRAVLRHAG